jgi:peroxiredoxin
MQTLRIGDRFPDLQARALDGSTWRIPEELRDLNAVLLFYRGYW